MERSCSFRNLRRRGITTSFFFLLAILRTTRSVDVVSIVWTAARHQFDADGGGEVHDDIGAIDVFGISGSSSTAPMVVIEVRSPLQVRDVVHIERSRDCRARTRHRRARGMLQPGVTRQTRPRRNQHEHVINLNQPPAAAAVNEVSTASAAAAEARPDRQRTGTQHCPRRSLAADGILIIQDARKRRTRHRPSCRPAARPRRRRRQVIRQTETSAGTPASPASSGNCRVTVRRAGDC